MRPAPDATPPEAGPLRVAATRFAENWIAVGALGVLLVIAVLAVFAPWLSPQDPYDLNALDVREGKRPPTAQKRSQPVKVELDVLADLSDAALPTVRIQPARSVDADAAGYLRVRFNPDASSQRVRVAISVPPESPLAPLREIRISGLPRGVSLSRGEKDRFQNRWTLRADDLSALEIVSTAKPVMKLRLRLSMVGGDSRVLMTYWLGTDDQGRDMLSAIFYGLRTSLIVALASVVIAVTIGTLIGLNAAYLGGRFDAFVMRLVDLQLSFPTILVALILLAVLGKGLGNVLLALIIVQWAFYARTVRGIALAERGKEYVEAAQCLSLSTPRILILHILPNCLPSLIVVGTLQIASAITLEATLSFLGLGLPVTKPSLGLLISNGFEYLGSGYPWISVMPGAALLVTVVSINLVGDELRDILNPRLDD